MKKTLTFIPLGMAISSAIIYLLNVFNYKAINNSVAMIQILSNLRIYLYISIGSFILYFLVKILVSLNIKKTEIREDGGYEPIEKVNNTVIKEIILTGNKYCSSCGEKIFDMDNYCKNCGSYQKDKKSGINPIIKNIINLLEIVILILVLYFLLNMLFDYKEKNDKNFKSPFKIEMTK